MSLCSPYWYWFEGHIHKRSTRHWTCTYQIISVCLFWIVLAELFCSLYSSVFFQSNNPYILHWNRHLSLVYWTHIILFKSLSLLIAFRILSPYILSYVPGVAHIENKIVNDTNAALRRTTSSAVRCSEQMTILPTFWVSIHWKVLIFKQWQNQLHLRYEQPCIWFWYLKLTCLFWCISYLS